MYNTNYLFQFATIENARNIEYVFICEFLKMSIPRRTKCHQLSKLYSANGAFTANKFVCFFLSHCACVVNICIHLQPAFFQMEMYRRSNWITWKSNETIWVKIFSVFCLINWMSMPLLGSLLRRFHDRNISKPTCIDGNSLLNGSNRNCGDAIHSRWYK